MATLQMPHSSRGSIGTGTGTLMAALMLLMTLPLGCSALASSNSKSINKEGCALQIPESLQVPPGFTSKESWQTGSMIPLDLSLGQVTPQPELSVSEMIKQQLHSSSNSNSNNNINKAGAIVFAVRRPG